ncbi:DUF4149 domain-containing protein [Simonsiella muelleri]|uniref:DUF4149 domain-containing protein n=1 Tax=Simonsiella muelleri TaxID=72 RepID=UPI0023F1545D|nr:DUF4149 domain-containing protein [Simonsiella muelleri]
MKRLSALLIAIWLGMQMGFAYIVSPVLFTNTLLSNGMATRLMGSLFQLSNGLGVVTWVVVWLNCRGNPYWGESRANRVRQWIIVMIMGLLVSLLLGWVVKYFPDNVLVHWLGGGFGVWRGSWHLLNMGVALLGLGLAIRLLRLDSRN